MISKYHMVIMLILIVLLMIPGRNPGYFYADFMSICVFYNRLVYYLVSCRKEAYIVYFLRMLYCQYTAWGGMVLWGAFEGSLYFLVFGKTRYEQTVSLSERSLQRSEFERAAHGFSGFPNA